MKRIAVIGTGYVGLVSGAGLSDFGHQVICCDIDQRKIDLLAGGEIPIYEPGLEEVVARNVQSGRLKFTTDLNNAIERSEVIFIAVGTPQGPDGAADMSAVNEVIEQISATINEYKVICTKSTVPIGTGSRIIARLIESGVPTDLFDYISNPEFLREGAAVKDFLWPDRVIIGAESERACIIMRDVYRPLYLNETPIVHTDITTAEMIKYSSNAFLALKISYINEIANLCEVVGADVNQVAKAMGLDGRISAKFLHPGPGYGGSCFPKDTSALVTMANLVGVEIGTIKAAIAANDYQKHRMVAKIKKLMGGEIKRKKIAVLGLSFKPQTDDIRYSASQVMLEKLIESGANVNAYDPIAIESMREKFPDINYCRSWVEAVENADGAVIMTEWNEFRGLDLVALKSLMKSPVILDTRNILPIDKLMELGFKFDTVGRGGNG